MKKIKEKIEKVKKNRMQRRSVRKKRQVSSFALIGYTNSGKKLSFKLSHKVQCRSEKPAFL